MTKNYGQSSTTKVAAVINHPPSLSPISQHSAASSSGFFLTYHRVEILARFLLQQIGEFAGIAKFKTAKRCTIVLCIHVRYRSSPDLKPTDMFRR